MGEKFIFLNFGLKLKLKTSIPMIKQNYLLTGFRDL